MGAQERVEVHLVVVAPATRNEEFASPRICHPTKPKRRRTSKAPPAAAIPSTAAAVVSVRDTEEEDESLKLMPLRSLSMGSCDMGVTNFHNPGGDHLNSRSGDQ